MMDCTNEGNQELVSPSLIKTARRHELRSMILRNATLLAIVCIDRVYGQCCYPVS